MIVSGKPSFKPAPEGVHNAVCTDVVDLGEVPTQFGPKHKCRLVFQIDATDPENDNKRFIIGARFNASLHQRSSLNKFLKSWRGREFTKEELEAFDLEKLVGANAQLVIQHEEREGQVYANITSILKPKVKLEPDKNYTRVKDRKDQPVQDAKTPDDPPPADENEPF